MSDIENLLQQHGAPLPKAMAMETEVRSEGALMMQTLSVPSWAANLQSSSVLAEWRCTLGRDDLVALQAHLKTLSTTTGMTTQQAINEAFKALDIGAYLGTFIEEGLLVDGQATVRVLFAYRSATLTTAEAINGAIHGLLTNPGAWAEASAALTTLRQMWSKGTDKWEGGLMMLSEVNLFDPGRFPYSRAKLGTP
jgi:hypothetical protein